MDKSSLQRLYNIQEELNSMYENMTISPKIEFVPLKETFMANISFIGKNRCFKGLKLDNKTRSRVDKFIKNVINSFDEEYKELVIKNYKNEVISFFNKNKILTYSLVCKENKLFICDKNYEIFLMDMTDKFIPKTNKINGIKNYYFNSGFIDNIVYKIESYIKSLNKDVSSSIAGILEIYNNYNNSKNNLKDYLVISKNLDKDNIFILDEKGLYFDSDCGIIYNDGRIENEVYPLNFEDYIFCYNKFLKENNLKYIFSKGCLFSDYCDIIFEKNGIYFDIVLCEKYNVDLLFDILQEKLDLKFEEKINKSFRISEINDLLNISKYPLYDWLYIRDIDNIDIENNLNAQFVCYILFKNNPGDLNNFISMLHLTEDFISIIEDEYIYLLSHYNHDMYYELIDMQISLCDDDYKVNILNNIIKKHKKYF